MAKRDPRQIRATRAEIVAGIAADIVPAREAGLEEEHLAELDLLLRRHLAIDRDRARGGGLEQSLGKPAEFLIVDFRADSGCRQHQRQRGNCSSLSEW